MFFYLRSGALRVIVGCICALLCLSLFACGQDDPEPREEVHEIPPHVILRNSAETMAQLSGFHFLIDRDGALAYVDPSETLAFGSGEGDYVSPDRARAQVKIIAPGFITSVSVISVGEVQWETNVVTGNWQELPPDWGFNPTVIFDAEIGLQAILTRDARNVAYLGEAELDDSDVDGNQFHVSGELDGESIYKMSGGLIGPDALTFEAWVSPNSYELQRVIVTDPSEEPDGEPTLWQIDFSEFGRTVDIQPPEN